MDINQIMELLPHSYPFLLVDRVIEVEPGKRLVAIKNVTINEPFFPGHIPQTPVMPGVLIAEALAQSTGLLAMSTSEVANSGIYYLVGLDKTRFKRPVIPGDQLHLEVSLLKRRRGVWAFKGIATVEGDLCASTEIMCTAQDYL